MRASLVIDQPPSGGKGPDEPPDVEIDSTMKAIWRAPIYVYDQHRGLPPSLGEDLLTNYVESFDAGWVDKEMLRELDKDKHVCTFVIRRGAAELVSAMTLEIFRGSNYDLCAHIIIMATPELLRGSGHGGNLLNHVRRTLCDAGVRALWTQAAVGANAADVWKFWVVRNGFRESTLDQVVKDKLTLVDPALGWIKLDLHSHAMIDDGSPAAGAAKRKGKGKRKAEKAPAVASSLRRSTRKKV